MDVKSAQIAFHQLLSQIDDETSRRAFVSWVSSSFPCADDDDDDSANEKTDEILKSIAATLRSQLPPSAILPSETIRTPPSIDVAHTVHLDSFLYDDELMDELFLEGKLAKYYCTRCNSLDIKPLNVLSHSMSRDRMRFIFQSLLPKLNGKCVVDIGSRLGAVLYGAYCFSSAFSIVGIEMNVDFCKLQQLIVDKWKMGDRIRIVHGDAQSFPQILQSGDVIFLHNVFEYFLPVEEQIARWNFLRSNVRRSGTLLVVIPDLKQSLNDLHIDAEQFLNSWVNKLPLQEILSSSSGLIDEAMDISLYCVN